MIKHIDVDIINSDFAFKILVGIVLYGQWILNKKINVFCMNYELFIRLFLNAIKIIIFKQITFIIYEFKLFIYLLENIFIIYEFKHFILPIWK